MTEFLLRSITKGKFEEWYPESFPSLEAVCEQVEDWGNRTGDDVPEMVEVIELERAQDFYYTPQIEASFVTLKVSEMLADRERKREEESKEQFEITASGRTRKI